MRWSEAQQAKWDPGWRLAVLVVLSEDEVVGDVERCDRRIDQQHRRLQPTDATGSAAQVAKALRSGTSEGSPERHCAVQGGGGPSVRTITERTRLQL
jgi:hypothetical protein